MDDTKQEVKKVITDDKLDHGDYKIVGWKASNFEMMIQPIHHDLFKQLKKIRPVDRREAIDWIRRSMEILLED